MAVLTLPEAKKALGITDADEDGRDAELVKMLDGMTPVIEGEVGPVVVRQITVRARSNGRSAVLPTSNVISVDAITDRATGQAVPFTNAVVDGAILRAPGGAIPGGSDLLVTVTVGMNPIPENVKSMAREILDLAWATQRGNDRPAFLVPYRAAAYTATMPHPLGFA